MTYLQQKTLETMERSDIASLSIQHFDVYTKRGMHSISFI